MAKHVDQVRLQNVRKRLPAIEAQLGALAGHCRMLNDSAASWQQVPSALLDVQVDVAGQAKKLLDSLAKLESEASALRATGIGRPPRKISPGRPASFQSTADLPAGVKRAKQAAASFDRSFREFRKTVDNMMNDPMRAAAAVDPVTPIAQVIDQVGTIWEIVQGIVEWSKRKR
ncbi:MAG: hypothetical protein FJ091_09265 [Deltaproteobacteria bacterium]|nr:hypothetical protein [Deltaproteobacteria bacterium]